MRTRFKRYYLAILYVLLTASLILALCSVCFARASKQESPVGVSGDADVTGATGAAGAIGVAEPENEAAAPKGKTFLLLGIDGVSYSSDVIMLAHVDSDGHYVKLLQMPRDSYTADHGKLNSLFAAACNKARTEGKDSADCYMAGAQALASFLDKALGVKIQSCAVLTLKDFRSLVDSVGGVPITLPQDLDYEDPAQALSIHLKAGDQLLDGVAAEGLVRCRSAYPDADYGRMDAQKLFLSAFFKKLKYGTSPSELFAFVRSAYRSIYTDISLGEALAMGRAVITAKGDALLFGTVKGQGLKINSLYYEILPEKTLEQASLWLEGCFSKDTAKKLFGGNGQQVLSLYLAEPQSPFTIRSATELEPQ